MGNLIHDQLLVMKSNKFDRSINIMQCNAVINPLEIEDERNVDWLCMMHVMVLNFT